MNITFHLFYFIFPLQDEQMKHKDKRIKVLNEVLSGIKVCFIQKLLIHLFTTEWILIWWI
jgi:hypothetical protein